MNFALKEHPQRKLILGEVHARMVQAINCNSTINRIAFEIGHSNENLVKARNAFVDWCHTNNIEPPEPESRQHRFEHNNRMVSWELHTEFVTITWISEGLDEAGQLYEQCCLEPYLEYPVVVATAVEVYGVESTDGLHPKRKFDGQSLCSSLVSNETAVVFTDYRQNENGFTIFEIANCSLPPFATGVLVRRLLEAESYRTFALLGLPAARQALRDTENYERKHTDLLQDIDIDQGMDSNRQALQTLQALALEVELSKQLSSFRFSASYAYADIMARRFELLDEKPYRHFTMLAQFIRRRVDPAIATCRSVERRQQSLARKLGRATDLINTRIGEDIQRQNAKVLQSLNETSKRQYRLQSTVEGLSVIAISYYTLGLASYFLPEIGGIFGLKKSVVLAASVPIIVLLVWFFIQRIKSRHV